jgi:predicted ATPase/DNA-binding SARP family transcriptional activator
MSELIFSFLGPVQLSHPQTGEITIPKRKALALLTYLLIEVDHPHTRESLLGLLWPGHSTAAAQNNLRVTCSQLQKHFEKAQKDAQPFLISNRLDLQFNPLNRYELDVTLFRSLVEACRTHPHTGQPQDCAECTARLAQAVKLVRGPLLDGFSLSDCPAFDEWLFFQRERLQLQISAALEQLADFHERTGNLAEAETYVRRLLEFDPLREHAHRQLMRLLADAGQRSAALAQYETCRRLLADELGVSPAPETTLLAEQIRLLGAQNNAPIHNLPPSFTRFIGRDQEKGRIEDLLATQGTRVVTLTGPGGVGKTRLALQTAHHVVNHFPNGVWLVELAGINNALSVPTAIAAALGILPDASRPPENTLEDYLRDKSLLLILDNCEQLIESCAQLVKAFSNAAPGLVVLVTSRIPLHIAGEHVVRLGSLSTPQLKAFEPISTFDALQHDAIQLFASRASHALISFFITDSNATAVAQICHQLDGMPLAIELAAARVSSFPIEEIAKRLDQRFRWRNAQAAGKLSRQQTLWAMIDWSYDLLDDQARDLFKRLSVFAGGWDLEAAEAICSDQEMCVEPLGQLVDQSLVVFGYDPENRRYRMHETIRQFAQEQLRGSDQEADALERHAQYYAQIVSRAAENQGGQTLPELLHPVQDDHDNMRLAFEWLLVHDPEQALTLVAQLGTELNFWELAGFFQEGRRWLQRALEQTQELVSLQRGRALLAAAELSSAISDFDYGLQGARQAQDLFQQLGDQRGEIDARLTYCELAELAGKHANLQAQVDEALRVAERISYTAGIAKAKLVLGTIAFHAGENQVAIQYVLPSIALWREIERPFELATALNRLAGALSAVHEYAAAQQAYEECRDLYQSLGYRRGVATAVQNLGGFAFDLGDYARARALFCDALRIRHELGLQRGYAYSFEFIADVDEIEKRYERAVQLLAAAETLRTRIGAPVEQINQKENEDALTRLRAQLGDVVFELEWAKGATLTTEQALALALS